MARTNLEPRGGPAESEQDRIEAAYARRRPNERYAASDPANLFMLQETERRLLKLLRHQGLMPLRDKRILEIGCGSGYWLREFVKWGADATQVAGVDLLSNRIAAAKSVSPRNIQLVRGDGADLPFGNGQFDLVGQFTVFTSILDFELKRRVAQEALRVLKPRGLIVWYDFLIASPHNGDVRAVRRREIKELFPGCSITLFRDTLAPPLARLTAPRSWLLCALLDSIPLFRTHYLGAIRRP